jgi:hypothetical protein
MSRNRVAERAEQIYSYLKADLNRPHLIGDILHKLKIKDGATTRAAIKRARELATADGLHFPTACPANNFSYTVTNDPSAAFDPVLHLARLAQGVQATKKVGVDFMDEHVREMQPSDRAMAKGYLAFEKTIEDAVSTVQAAAAELTKATVSARREMRSESS